MFAVELPSNLEPDIGTGLHVLDDIVKILKSPTIDLVVEMGTQLYDGNLDLSAAAIWKYINSLKQVEKATGVSRGSVLGKLFGPDVASTVMDKLGGINGVLDIVDLPNKAMLTVNLTSATLLAPADYRSAPMKEGGEVAGGGLSCLWASQRRIRYCEGRRIYLWGAGD